MKTKKDKIIEENVIKDVRNLLRLKKEISSNTMKSFRLKKENKAIKERLIRDNRNFFEHEEEDFYKLVRVGNFLSNNYMERESDCDRNIALSLEKYLNKVRPYLKEINNLKKSDTWKFQLTIQKR